MFAILIRNEGEHCFSVYEEEYFPSKQEAVDQCESWEKEFASECGASSYMVTKIVAKL